MAKEKTAGSPALADYKPRLYLDLEDAAILAKLKVGKEVTLVLKGTVCGMSQSKRTDPDGKVCKHQSLDIEDYSIKLSERTQWDELNED